MKTYKKTPFEKLCIRIFATVLIVTTLVSMGFGTFATKYNRDIQTINNEIAQLEGDIDSLTINKQELTSFDCISDIASAKGYTYQNDAVATNVGSSLDENQ